MNQTADAFDAVDVPTLLRFIHYPDSDGKPMADNTKQYQYIITLQVGLDSQFADDPNVFVAGDLLWYPSAGPKAIAGRINNGLKVGLRRRSSLKSCHPATRCAR
jgi:Uma2 family endonuclease